jgi:hypothetical protein
MKVTVTGANILLEVANNIFRAENAIPNALFEAGKNSELAIKKQIADGKGTDNQSMTTKSPETYERYSKRYAERTRLPKGKPTDKVTLNVTGDLIKDFTIIEKGKDRVVVGFESVEKADLAEWQETYYGMDIFDANEKTIQTEAERFFKAIDKEMGV